MIESVHRSEVESSKPLVRRVGLRQPARFALVVALIGGLVFALVTPPMRGADEGEHLVRAYQLATGQIATTRRGNFYGTMVPSGYQDYMGKLNAALFGSRDHTAFVHLITSGSATGKKVFAGEGTVGSYGPGAYVAYLPALSLGTLFGLPIGVLIYLARVSGVIAFALILALAVRRMPGYKWFLVAVGLIPEMLNQASTVSADGLTNALALLVVAWYFRLAEDQRLSRRDLVEIGVASLLLAAAKPPYFLFAIPVLLLAFKHRAQPRFSLMGWLVAAATPVFVVAFEYQRHHSSRLDVPGLLPWTGGGSSNYAYRDIHTGAQLQALLHAPWNVAAIIFRTIEYQGLRLPRQMIGLLGAYQLPGWLVLLSVLGLVLAGVTAWRNYERPGGTRTDAVVMLATTLVLAVAICISVYDLADALRAPRIDGLTPRYFLALIPGVVLSLCALRRSPASATAASGMLEEPVRSRPTRLLGVVLEPWVLQLLLAAVLIASAVGMIHYYYTGPAVL